jgi:multicomponent Na+:H+ antiporter subunit E
VRGWTVSGIAFGVIWVFVRGVEPDPEAVLGQFLVGLAVGLPVAYLFRRLYAETIPVRRSLRAVPSAVLYLLVFLKEVVVANVDVAYRVLAPREPIEPQVILVPLRVQTDLGVTTIANSITLTPGSVTLDHDHDRNALYVHIIDGRRPYEVVEPIRAWEDYALRIFDEERSPDEPAPDIRIHPPEMREPPEPTRAPIRERSGEGGESGGE